MESCFWNGSHVALFHYSNVIMSTMASQITSLTIVYSTVYSGANLIIHQSPASLAFMMGIHRWPVNSPHKGSVTRKMFLFRDVIMLLLFIYVSLSWENIIPSVLLWLFTPKPWRLNWYSVRETKCTLALVLLWLWRNICPWHSDK